MTITATDSASGTYWVTKIDSRTCTLTPGGSAPGAQFTANAQVIWSMNAAVVNTTVKLATND
jgi:membrane-bound inhibitor of C-type lysozyme